MKCAAPEFLFVPDTIGNLEETAIQDHLELYPIHCRKEDK